MKKEMGKTKKRRRTVYKGIVNAEKQLVFATDKEIKGVTNKN
jgi:hypothetical protein